MGEEGEADPDMIGGEEDHVEGLQFLAERDMRSLHRVSLTPISISISINLNIYQYQ